MKLLLAEEAVQPEAKATIESKRTVTKDDDNSRAQGTGNRGLGVTGPFPIRGMTPDNTPPTPAQSATPKPQRTDIFRLQGVALCDERTAIKALTFGPEHVRGIVGERVARAMVELGLRPLCPQNSKRTVTKDDDDGL